MTLTDRYVTATLSRLAEDQRSDVESQLREAIGDAVDDRIDAGVPAGQAERDVLNEMGDPERLAASYADRSLFLIGPEYFLAWKRLTVLLLWIVLPIMAVLIPLGGWIDGDGWATILGTTVGGTLTVGVHLVFWVTLVFAAIERGRVKASDVTEPWTVDRLPEQRDATVTWGDTAGTVVVIALTTVALVWQQLWPWARTADGEGLPLLDPSLWTFVLPALLVVMGIELAAAIARQMRGHWTMRDWWLNVAVNVAGVALVAVPVVGGEWLNRELFAEIGWPDAATDLTIANLEWGTLAIVAAVAVWDIVDSYRKARRAR
ncbi:hypothetical protein [Demequina sp. NBRC 110057]|uniref:HAAS signaling domain-containing protein n=1 Tax=Demequina sp. NBRC 110057 TaxID=1570346 RepID=UPI000A03937A|nr:hypothetical protein [Demequina sp. NBRC 110057]